MERYTISVNGQEVQIDDLNLLGAAAQEGDRALFDLFQPGNGFFATGGVGRSRGIIPWDPKSFGGGLGQPSGAVGRELFNYPMVAGRAADGAVSVFPFKAFIGTPITTSGSVTENTNERAYTNAHSAYLVSTGTFASATRVSFLANSTGFNRWDLIYATFTPDVSQPGITRYKKDPATNVVTATTVSTSVKSQVTVSVFAGAPTATPVFPEVPADSGGSYIIPIAYIRIPNGFNATSTILQTDIHLVSRNATLSPSSTGACIARPATGMWDRLTDSANGLGSFAVESAWANSGVRPGWVIPPDMMGCETLFIAVDLEDVSSSNWSHRTNAVIDNSRDWRKRLFVATAFFQGGGAHFAWSPTSLVSPGALVPSCSRSERDGIPTGVSFGQSFVHDDSDCTFGDLNVGGAFACLFSGADFPASGPPATVTALPSGAAVGIYCTHANDGVNPGGQLRLYVKGVPANKVIIKLDCYGPMTSTRLDF